MVNFLSEEMRRNPYAAYDQIRSTSPVLHDPGANVWMIFDYEGAKRALSDHDTFRSGVRAPVEWLVFLDPPRHTKLRGLIHTAFTPRSIANLEPRIQQLSRQLLDEKIGQGEFDLVVDYSAPLPMLVIAEMLGVPARDRAIFKHWSDVILDMSYTVTGGDEGAAKAAMIAFREVTGEMNSYLSDLLAHSRAAPEDDLLTRLGQSELDGARLSQEEILAFFQLLLVAGQETTANLISNAVLCLLENPDQLALLRRTPGLLPSAIEEVLRYRSPVQWMMRSPRNEVTLHGQTIPAGKHVLPMIGSANRDPAQFPEAGRFDITRSPNPHIAFGHGIHFCLGAALSRLEAKVALTDVIERLPGLKLSSDGPWEPRKALNVHGPNRLPIRFRRIGRRPVQRGKRACGA